MARITITLQEATADALRDESDREGKSFSELIEERLTYAPGPAPEHVQRAFTLAEAAEVFMSVLDRGHVELLRALARDSKQHPSAYLLSAIKLAHENGQTALLMPSCLGERLEPLAATAGEATCAWCHQVFVMTNPGQRFCPQPKVAGAESCSRQAALDAIRTDRVTRRPKNLTLRPSRRVCTDETLRVVYEYRMFLSVKRA